MVLALTDIQLFQILKEKLGEKEAEALVTFVEVKVNENVKQTNEQNLKVLATKEDIYAVNENTNKKIAETNERIASLRTELKTDIANVKAEMIKWMFIFWIGQLAAFVAIAKFFFSK